MHDRDLVTRARAGDMRSLARILTEIENRTDAGRTLFADVFPTSGSAWVTGVTGAPGAGKSTLVSGLAAELLDHDRLAIVAVDPSSPFSGGAILGDRIRMADHAGDDRVYIRSLANRGALGGISETTPPVVAALDGLGFPEILVETVGVGQSEIEVATTADTTVVVVSPGWGDAIQTSKAGFLEIADILVVNKADREGAESAARDLESMIATGPPAAWTPPVLMTTATVGTGVEELGQAIRDHRSHLEASGSRSARRRRAAARQLAAAIRLEAEETVDTAGLDDVVTQVAERSVDPWTAATRLLAGK